MVFGVFGPCSTIVLRLEEKEEAKPARRTDLSQTFGYFWLQGRFISPSLTARRLSGYPIRLDTTASLRLKEMVEELPFLFYVASYVRWLMPLPVIFFLS